MKLYQLFVTLLGIVTLTATATAAEPTAAAQAIRALEETRGVIARVTVHPATGVADLADFGSVGLPLAPGTETFFDAHGAAFGVTDPATQLELTESFEDDLGMTHLGYRQLHRGLPVWGAELRVHLHANGRVRAVNGLFVPAIDLDTRPALSIEQAKTAALATLDPDPPTPYTAHDPQLLIYRTNLSIGKPGTNHLAYWVPVSGPQVESAVVVDARSGVVIDAIDGIQHTRQIYLPGDGPAPIFVGRCGADHWCVGGPNVQCIQDSDCRTTCDNVVEGADCAWKDGDPQPFQCGPSTPNCPAAEQTVVEDGVNAMIRFAQDTVDYLDDFDGYDSWNGMDGDLHHLLIPPDILLPLIYDCSSPNAFWARHPMNSDRHSVVDMSTNYCYETTADDIVAHEWAHGYTFMFNGLEYRNQPGALNEGFSDIWGENVDLTNNEDVHSDRVGPRTAGNCSVFDTSPIDTPVQDNSYRWLIGEDAAAFGGALRDMWSPHCYANPGRVGDPYYLCDNTALQSAIVHINSGIPNRAYAMLVDGSRDAGPGDNPPETVGAIGSIKASRIYWRAQRIYHHSESRFPDHADALTLACRDLVGVITIPDDCDQVAAAIEAVGLNTLAIVVDGQCVSYEPCPTERDCTGGDAPCDSVGCQPVGATVVANSGMTACAQPDESLYECGPGETIHLLTTQCEECDCCDGGSGGFCVCPNDGCGETLSFECRPNGPDGAAPGSMVVAPDLFVARLGEALQFSWIGAGSYDVIGGDLQSLLDGDGDFASAVSDCIVNDYPGTSVIHTEASPDVRFYLVRPAADPQASYDSLGARQFASRDASIAQSPLACPD